MTRRVPELSLRHYLAGDAGERAAFEQALFAGLQDYGFVILADHGVAESLLDSAYATAQRFFALPLAEKLACRGGLRGYTPFGVEHAKDHAVPDLKEFFQVGREPASAAHLGEDITPAAIAKSLGISREAVRGRIDDLLRKLGVRSRHAAVVALTRAGIPVTRRTS